MKEDLLRHRGKGFVPYQQESEEFFPEVKGGHYPERIFVLSDIYCGSSGDNFVQMMKQFKKVTVVGRPTLGILDYSNCCTVDYGDYQLMFPYFSLSMRRSRERNDGSRCGAGYRGSMESRPF